jgi:sterol desaturase/sphingolipid hydroxylase (fatty acid hydroxylase superfamily)
VLPRHHLFHVCHHCKYPDRCFGVTVTWWDRLFLTSPPKEFILPATVYQVYYLKK